MSMRPLVVHIYGTHIAARVAFDNSDFKGDRYLHRLFIIGKHEDHKFIAVDDIENLAGYEIAALDINCPLTAEQNQWLRARVRRVKVF